MRWSKLNQLPEQRFSDHLRDRLKIQLTKYHHTKNEQGELLILLDGNRIYSASEWSALHKTDGDYYNNREAHQADGISTEYDAPSHLFASLSISIDSMLTHRDPLIRAFGAADQRSGRRRLNQLKISDENDLVQQIVKARLGARAGKPPRN